MIGSRANISCPRLTRAPGRLAILCAAAATLVLALVTGCSFGEALDNALEPSETRTPSNTPLPPTATPIPTATAAPGSVAIIQVFNSGYKEYVEIVNRDESEWDISGWTLSGSKGEEDFEFPVGYVLDVGGSVRVHSGKDGVDSPPEDIYWTDKNVWNNSGERVSLRDATGREVSEYRY